MRVALLSYRSKPHCGGQGVYLRHLSRELVALGHDVEVFSGQPYPVLDEGVLDSVRSDQPPRTVSWVATGGAAASTGRLLAAALGGSMSAPFVVGSEVPPWIGALDVLVIAGDDAADPALVAAAATGVRRGARVVIVAPDEGPLREVAAGRAVVLGPRLSMPSELAAAFGMSRYLAAGLATLHTVDQGLRVDLAALADELDAEALRNSAARELLTDRRACGLR